MASRTHADQLTGLVRRRPQALAVLLLVVTLAALPVAGRTQAESTSFLPAFLAVVLVLDGLSAWLLLHQFLASGRLRTLVFGSSYAWCVVSVVPHALVFPGVVGAAGSWGAGPSAAPWLWTSWHVGFAGLIALGALPLSSLDRALRPGLRRQALAGAVLTLTGVAAAWAVLVVQAQDLLPTVIAAGDYTRLASTVGPYVIATSAGACLLTWHHVRRAIGLDRWLLPVAVACLGDVTLTLFAQSRYTTGWYVARALALTAAAVVLLALVGQMTRMYQDLESSAARLRAQAETDDLTGLPNRRALLEHGHRLADRDVAWHVALLDVDHFKRVNDEHGHDVGDQVLFLLGGRMAATLRTQDVFGRYGGEEFLVLLDTSSTDDAAAACERLRVALAARPLSTSAGPLRATVSIGLARVSPGHGLLPAITAADSHLYAAKAAGRNRVCQQPVALDPDLLGMPCPRDSADAVAGSQHLR